MFPKRHIHLVLTMIIDLICLFHALRASPSAVLAASLKYLNKWMKWDCLYISPGKTKIYCAKCQKKCSGEVLRVTDKYFHKACFQCIKCNKSLAIGGFFSKDSNYYCVADYQKTFGTKCAVCQNYVEGEVVSTMGNTYHQKCFTCTKCSQPFESGSKVISTPRNLHFPISHITPPPEMECTTNRILNENSS